MWFKLFRWSCLLSVLMAACLHFLYLQHDFVFYYYMKYFFIMYNTNSYCRTLSSTSVNTSKVLKWMKIFSSFPVALSFSMCCQVTVHWFDLRATICLSSVQVISVRGRAGKRWRKYLYRLIADLLLKEVSQHLVSTSRKQICCILKSNFCQF